MATLTETIAASANHDFLELAVKAAGMGGLLATTPAPTAGGETGGFTLLSPEDSFFMTMAGQVGYRGTDEATGFSYLHEALRLFAGGNDPKDLFRQFIEAHLVADKRDYGSRIADGFTTFAQASYSVAGGAISLNGTPTNVSFNIGTHIEADNGYIHSLNGLLSGFFIPDLSAPGVDLRIGGDRRSVINTGAGNDFVAGRGGNDHLVGGSGRDVVTGGTGRDKIFGGHGNDRLFGDSGSDSIFGGMGNDVIGGGAGNDVLRGYKGADTFVITKGGGRDVMPDFRADIDKIDVRDLGITSFADVRITYGKGRIFVDLGAEDLVIFGRRGNAPDADDFLFAA